MNRPAYKRPWWTRMPGFIYDYNGDISKGDVVMIDGGTANGRASDVDFPYAGSFTGYHQGDTPVASGEKDWAGITLYDSPGNTGLLLGRLRELRENPTLHVIPSAEGWRVHSISGPIDLPFAPTEFEAVVAALDFYYPEEEP